MPENSFKEVKMIAALPKSSASAMVSTFCRRPVISAFIFHLVPFFACPPQIVYTGLKPDAASSRSMPSFML